MAKEPKKLDDLFHDTLKDIYYAEKKILSALPKMAKAAQNEDLKAAFEKHEGETEEQVARLEQVFELIDEKPQGKKCAAIDGIVEEGQEIMKEYKGSPALDAGLLSAAQAVEHYEISHYGTLKTWANELGYKDAVKLLDEGQEIMKEYKGTVALDAGLLAAAQAVEHYEISRYGTLKAWAEELELTQAVKLLDATLAEEKKTDAALSQLAESVVNQQAEAA